MVAEPVKGMTPRRAPDRRRVLKLHIREARRLRHLLHREIHQARMAIGPVSFIGDPERAEIAFLKAMHRHAQLAGRPDRDGVIGPGVAIDDQIGDAPFFRQIA